MSKVLVSRLNTDIHLKLFIGDVASICGERGVYSRAAFNRVNKIMLVMINYLSPAHI